MRGAAARETAAGKDSVEPGHVIAAVEEWGDLLLELGRPQAALAAFETSARLSPMDPFAFNVHLGMGLANFGAGRPEMAVSWARRALSERPGLTWPYRDLAVYYSHAGDSAAAADALQRFLKAHPDMSLAAARDSLRFMNADLLRRYVEGLAMAGLA